MNTPNRLRLKSDVYSEQTGLLQGVLTDITDAKATLCLERNLSIKGNIKLRVYFHPLSIKDKPRSIDIAGSMKSLIYCSHHEDFRSEVQFTQFLSEEDKRFLKARLSV